MSVSVKTAAGTSANLSTTTLPNGDLAINHMTVNPDGSLVAPAQDVTLQQMLSAMQALTAVLSGQNIFSSAVLGALLSALPTSLPSQPGMAWLDNGTLAVS